jgi:hypothetical protein
MNETMSYSCKSCVYSTSLGCNHIIAKASFTADLKDTDFAMRCEYFYPKASDYVKVMLINQNK